MRIDKGQRTSTEPRLDRGNLCAVAFQTRAANSETARWDRERNVGAQAVAVAAGRQFRPWEKSQVGSGMTFRIRIEKVVRPGIILVHAFLHETHPEHARIKIQVLLRRS